MRVNAPELPVNVRVQNLDIEDVKSLGQNNIEEEANRCFNCGCVAVNPSDMAPALIALDARIITSKRKINAGDFWTAGGTFKSTALDSDEIVTEIQIPKPRDGVKSAFIKFALRLAIDFPIVNCAVSIENEMGKVKSAKICLNAVYSQPIRAIKAEDFIKGKIIDNTTAEGAGAAAVSDAVELPYSKYKIQIAKALVKRAILACK